MEEPVYKSGFEMGLRFSRGWWGCWSRNGNCNSYVDRPVRRPDSLSLGSKLQGSPIALGGSKAKAWPLGDELSRDLEQTVQYGTAVGGIRLDLVPERESYTAIRRGSSLRAESG